MFSAEATFHLAIGVLARALRIGPVPATGDDVRDAHDDGEVGMGDPWSMPASMGHVVTMPGTCWRCGEKVAPIVGLLVLPDGGSEEVGFIPFAACARLLATNFSPSTLSSQRVGALRPRWSRLGGRYLSNGCCRCDAIQGNFPLEERLLEYQMEGHTLSELPRIGEIELPQTLLVAGWNLADSPEHCYTILELG